MPEFTSTLPLLLMVAALAYLLGSVPFGILVSRLFGLGDLRSIGSGNIGATNVLRTGNKRAAALTLLLDAGKGAAAVLIARWWTGAEDAAQIAGFAAFLGHIFPVWLKFRGGKGVATFFGTLLAISWPVGLAAAAVWLAMAALTRYSSAAALMAAACSPMLAILLMRSELLVLTTLLCSVIWLTHRGNIRRLKEGTESRILQKSQAKPG